ncbi:MAG: NAD(+)/NADH kinase, partial [Syntrophales bacterium]|nr:NAD(+)/NADH kinase [Syntrophales bacterium]
MFIQKVGIVANTAKEASRIYTIKLRDWMVARGIEVLFHREIAAVVGDQVGYERGELAELVDLVVVFGGDGTMLRTARAVRKAATPIVGINLGGFGYLTEINLSEMFDAFEVILRGEHVTENRMMLDVTLETAGKTLKERTVLNDAVINRGNLSRIVDLETKVNGRF